MFKVNFLIVTLAFLLSLELGLQQEVQAGEIEAIKGKRYTITKKHGPWMIMVATLREAPEGMKTTGLTPEQAADELVYELRTRGVPSYVIKRDETQANVSTTNRLGKEEERTYRLSEEYCVLAGNYSSSSDPVINKTLEYIKKIHPECMKQGAIYRPRGNQSGPLSHAFKTVNPLLNQEEVTLLKKDPEIEYLNNDMGNLSLLKQSGKYTVVVATFAGKSIFSKGDEDIRKLNSKLDAPKQKMFAESNLDANYLESWTLAKKLREKNMESYIYHDRFKSLVTIGSFDSEDDPAIKTIKEQFCAKYKQDPKSGKTGLVGEVFLLPSSKARTASVSNIMPGFTLDQEAPRMVIFDPQPKVVQMLGTKLRQVE